VIALAIAACGARTGLLVDDGGAQTEDVAPEPDSDRPDDADVPPDDADVPPDATPPDCGEPLSPSEVRARFAGVFGRVAIDPDGIIYAPVRGMYGLDLAAIDPCGELLWQAEALPDSSERGRPQAHLYRDDEVLLAAASFPTTGNGFARFRRDGDRLPDFPFDSRIGNLVGVSDDYGPVLRAHDFDDGITYLSRLSPEAEDRVGIYGMPGGPDAALVWPDECAIFGRLITCFDIAFDLDSLEQLWRRDERIVDGTLRHVTPPAAMSGGRFATIIYGINTYNLVVRSTDDGGDVWEESLVRSTVGQVGLLAGGPVISQSGRVITYLNSGDSGSLRAHEPDGALAWSHGADAILREFNFYATHAAGVAGLIYLAVGSSVRAVREDDGSISWSRDDLGEFHGRCVTLSPNSDLVVLTDDDELLIIATASGGPARSRWPAPGGGPRNANAGR